MAQWPYSTAAWQRLRRLNGEAPCRRSVLPPTAWHRPRHPPESESADGVCRSCECLSSASAARTHRRAIAAPGGADSRGPYACLPQMGATAERLLLPKHPTRVLLLQTNDLRFGAVPHLFVRQKRRRRRGFMFSWTDGSMLPSAACAGCLRENALSSWSASLVNRSARRT